jgi:hypothetical protein
MSRLQEAVELVGGKRFRRKVPHVAPLVDGSVHALYFRAGELVLIHYLKVKTNGLK